jgi:hypothetical protein
MEDLIPQEMGQPHQPPHTHSPGVPEPINPIPKKQLHWAIIAAIAVGGFLAFVFLILGCVWSMGTPVMKAGETFLTQVTAGQVDQAYDSAAAQFKEAVPKETFQEFLKEFPIATKVKSVSFNQFEIENNQAFISGSVTGTDLQVLPVHMRLVNEGGAWKVLYVDFLTEEQIIANQQAAMQAQQQAEQQQQKQGQTQQVTIAQPVSGEAPPPVPAEPKITTQSPVSNGPMPVPEE